MNVKTKAIVLSSIKYNDKSLIVKCFTLSDGLKSYFVPSAYSSKKNNQKIAYFQPLTILEIETIHKNSGGLSYFKELKIASAYKTNSSHVYKATILIFLSEILSNSIKEEEKNDSLFTFLETALLWLDEHDDFANFHLILLLEMTKFLGFYPDISDFDLKHFNLNEGFFLHFEGTNCLNEYETHLFKKLLQLKFFDHQKVFAGIERQILLSILLSYFEIHLDGFRTPKSLAVLKEVFS